MARRDLLSDMGYDDAVVFENPDYDNAILGVTHDGRAVYDYDRMVGCLMDEDGMEYIDAVEFIDYNTIRSIPYAGSNAPVILFKLNEEDIG